MRPAILVATLALSAWPLSAQTPRDPTPFFLEFRLDTPSSGLKEAVGNRPSLNASFGWLFHTAPSGRLAFALRMDADSFQDTSRHLSAQGVGFGPEFTANFQAPERGFFLRSGLLFQSWSLTTRNSGGLQDTQYIRAKLVLATGYRFPERWSLALTASTTPLDPATNLDTWGLALRWHL